MLWVCPLCGHEIRHSAFANKLHHYLSKHKFKEVAEELVRRTYGNQTFEKREEM